MIRSLCFLLLFGWADCAGASVLPAEKEAVARAVFDRLVAARGGNLLPAPDLVFSRQQRSAARSEGSTIVLEEAAYDVCAALGADAEAALAGILAHELVHYYEAHARQGEVYSLVGADAGAKSSEMQNGLVGAEAEADYQGGFLAHMAGYPSINVMPRVLDGIYRAYRLPESIAGYPSLTDRKGLADRAYARLTDLLSVFEMGNALAALDRYAEAATYYDYLLTEFQSREVYNNTGVLYVKAALPYFRPATLRYDYPVALDLRSRLNAQARNVEVDVVTRNFYLNEAIVNFRRAHLLDDDYAPALVNLASAQALLGQSLLEGEPTLETLEIARDKLLEAGIRAREAVRLADRQGEEKTAENGRSVLHILDALAAETNDTTEPDADVASDVMSAHNGFVMTERIGGADMVEVSAELPDSLEDVVVSRGGERMSVASFGDFAPRVTILRHRPINGEKPLIIARVEKGYTGHTAMEIGIGSGESEVKREYGEPSYTVLTVGGELLIYKNSQLVFSLRGGAVEGWFLYL